MNINALLCILRLTGKSIIIVEAGKCFIATVECLPRVPGVVTVIAHYGSHDIYIYIYMGSSFSPMVWKFLDLQSPFSSCLTRPISIGEGVRVEGKRSSLVNIRASIFSVSKYESQRYSGSGDK